MIPKKEYTERPIRLFASINGKIKLVAIGGDYKNADGSLIKEDKKLYASLAKDFPMFFADKKK